MILVSVIIPYYNSHHTLNRCLDSVRKQTISNFEIIIVNDASPDWKLAKKIIDDFNFNNLITISHKFNLNGSAARNTGINFAKGKYIALLDSDDEWFECHLQNCIEYIDKNNYENDNVLLFSSVMIQSNIKKYKDYITPIVESKKIVNVCEEIYCSGKMISCPTYFFNKNIFEIIQFDESLNRFQDIDFIIRLSNVKENKIYQINSIGAIVHWEEISIKTTINKGINIIFLEKFLDEKKVYFTDKALRKFIIKEILPVYSYNRNIIGIIRLFKNYSLFNKIKLIELNKLLIYFLIGKNYFSWKIINFIRGII